MQSLPPDLPKTPFDDHLPPGEHLLEWCEERQLSLAEAASRLDLSARDLEHLLSGQLTLNPPLADKLAQLTRVPASLWLNLESLYHHSLKKRNDLGMSI